MIKICRDCGARVPANQWQSHRQEHRNAEKPSTVEKGYGAEHRRMRREWAPRVATGQVACARCGELIAADADWHMDHVDGDKTRWLGPSHQVCNQGTAVGNRTPTEIHKAEPAPQFAEDAASICIHCHRDIKRVPGGDGPTWVHADSGAVVGFGSSAS